MTDYIVSLDQIGMADLERAFSALGRPDQRSLGDPPAQLGTWRTGRP